MAILSIDAPHTTLAEIAHALGIKKQNAHARSVTGAWRFSTERARGGVRRLYPLHDLPRDIVTAVLALRHRHHAPAAVPNTTAPENNRAADRETLWRRAERKTQAARDKGAERARIVRAVVDLAEHAGISFAEAAQVVGRQERVSVSNINNWYYGRRGKPGARHYHRSDWPAVLTDGYVGRTKTAECDPAAWDFFKADYLRPEAPAANACYERLLRAAEARGWPVPSVATLLRRIARELPRQAVVLAREGEQALLRLYPAQERDHAVFHAMEAVNADGHKFDLFVRWPDGEIVRPVMVAWQDIFSAKILSHRVDKTENTDAVRLSFGDMVERYGIPQHAYLDNGRGFASKWMTGGVANRYRFKVKEEEPTGIMINMGVDPHWATPYHGQAKPIERAFRDLAEYVSKHPAFAGAYTGNRPDAKPENYGSKAVPLDLFLRVLDEEIRAHNARTGRRSHVCQLRSFDEAFLESYQRHAITRATEEQRRLWLLAAEGVRASSGNGEVRLQVDTRNRYWSEVLSEYAGQPLTVRFDPQRLHDEVHVYTLGGQYIGRAECIARVGFNDSEAARELSRNKQRYKRAARDRIQAEKRMQLADAVRLLPETAQPEAPQPKIVRPYRPPPARAASHDTEQAATERDLRLKKALEPFHEQLCNEVVRWRK